MSRWSGTRFGSLASVNPLVACVPSQNGFIAEAPHRHSASWGVDRELLAERGAHRGDVGDQVGAVLRGHDRGRQGALELAELGDPPRPLPGRRLPDGQVLQRGDRLEQAGRRAGAEAGAQGGGGDGQVPEGRSEGSWGWRVWDEGLLGFGVALGSGGLLGFGGWGQGAG